MDRDYQKEISDNLSRLITITERTDARMVAFIEHAMAHARAGLVHEVAVVTKEVQDVGGLICAEAVALGHMMKHVAHATAPMLAEAVERVEEVAEEAGHLLTESDLLSVLTT